MVPLFGAAYAAPNKSTTILYWFRPSKTMLNPLANGKILGLLKAFECFSRQILFQGLFKTVLYILVLFKHVQTLTLFWATVVWWIHRSPCKPVMAESLQVLSRASSSQSNETKPWPHLHMIIAVGGMLNTNTVNCKLCCYFFFFFFLLLTNIKILLTFKSLLIQTGWKS